jgi:hypothetical protein
VSTRTLALLQWAGSLAGIAAGTAGFVGAYAVTEAGCGHGGYRLGTLSPAWPAAVLLASALCLLAAEAAAAAVVLRTRGVQFEDDPPLARIRFLAVAALPANLLLFTALVLIATAWIAAGGCRQS